MLFFDRVVVFVENLLSSQMGVVSAIRRSSRSADRRRKTQEPYGLYVELSIRFQFSSLSRLVLLLVAGCWLCRGPPPVGMWTKQVLARVGRHITSHGEGKRGSPSCSFLTRNSHRPVPGRGGRVHPGCRDALQLRGYIDDRLQGSS